MKRTLILNGLLMLTFWFNDQNMEPNLKAEIKAIEASN